MTVIHDRVTTDRIARSRPTADDPRSAPSGSAGGGADRHIIDLRSMSSSTGRATTTDDAETHILRLILDLQVDALLLTLGAAARAADEEQIPWRRWLVEDLDTARALATAILAADVVPAPFLGSGVAGALPDGALKDLAVRYQEMARLLSELIRRPSSAQHWRPTVHELSDRCQHRLSDLHHYRAALIVSHAPSSRGYLPGELLG